jgi:hypothetical protein
MWSVIRQLLLLAGPGDCFLIATLLTTSPAPPDPGAGARPRRS